MSDEAEYFTKGLDRGKDGRSSPLGAFNLADEKGAAAALAGWQAGQTARAHAEAIREAVETSSDDDDGPSYRYSSSPTSLDNVESGGPWTGIFIFLAVVGALILWVLSFFGVTQEWFHQLTQTVSPNSGRGQVAIEGVCTYKLDQDSNELSIFIPIIRNSYGWAHSGTLSIEAAMTNNPYGGKAMVDEWRSIGQITLSDTLTRDEYYHDIAQTFKLK